MERLRPELVKTGCSMDGLSTVPLVPAAIHEAAKQTLPVRSSELQSLITYLTKECHIWDNLVEHVFIKHIN